MYNVPVRFDGDIIITDPCYIINHDNDDKTPMPSWWDYLSKTTSEVIDGITFYYRPEPKDYPDCRAKTLSDCRNSIEEVELVYLSYPNDPIMFSPTLQMEEDAYDEATQRWCDEDHNDWDRCGGANFEVLGITTYLNGSTIYGDWSCTTYNTDTREPIGEFCADAGMVAVFLLDEVLRYNPDFNYHIERPWTTTLIKDFHGTVELHLEDDEVTVVGKGNVNFIGTQTGL